jgi:RNA polymerase I-specific transcription initiation factor RRN5
VLKNAEMDDAMYIQGSEQDSEADEQIIIKPLDSSSSYRAPSSNGSSDGKDSDEGGGYSRATPLAPRGCQPSDEWIDENTANQTNPSMDVHSRMPTHLQRNKDAPRSTSQRRESAQSRLRRETLKVKKSKADRFRSTYNDKYRQLLNADINNIEGATGLEGRSLSPHGWIGVTTWSSTEKEIFFTALSRLGKDDIRGIALRIGSKSELEVQEYIRLLYQGMVEEKLSNPRWQLLDLTDFPAALHISQEGCDMLEKAADGLAFRQNRHEEQVEESKWGSSWLLTLDVNHWVEGRLREKDGDDDIKKILPAITLLNLRNWLELSTKVFMNPAAPREAENWRSLVDSDTDEEPAIRATAFEDFYHLTVSVTRRLVSATIFCTMSRLRAMDPKNFNRSEIVRRADVEAAINSLGLEANSEKFWIGCPRRCNLAVHMSKSSTTKQTLIDYDELEIILARGKGSFDRATDGDNVSGPNSPHRAPLPFRISTSTEPEAQSFSSPETGSGSAHPEEQIRDLAVEYMANMSQDFDGPFNPSGSEFEHPNKHQERVLKRIRLKEELECAQHKYAEAFDVKSSLLEERRLWKLLNLDAPFSIKTEDIELPEKPAHHREGADEVIDWRDRLEFWSQWETIDKPMLAGAFPQRSTGKRKRRASELYISDDCSNSLASAEASDGNFASENQESVNEENNGVGGGVTEGELGSESGDVPSGGGDPKAREGTALQRPSPEDSDAASCVSRSSLASDFDPSVLPGFTDVMRARVRELARGDPIHPPCDQCRSLAITCFKGSKGMCTYCQNTVRERCSWVSSTEEEVFSI